MTFCVTSILAAEDKDRDFILVIDGSIPNEHNKAEGFWAAHDTRMDRPFGAESAGSYCRRFL